MQWNAQRIRKRRNSTHEQIKLHYAAHLAGRQLAPSTRRLDRLERCISTQIKKRGTVSTRAHLVLHCDAVLH